MTAEERSQLAAEWALRLLEAEEVERARGLAASDPAFLAEVAQWNGRLAALLDEVEPVAPPTGVLAAIERRIAEPPKRSDNVVQLRRHLNAWRGFAAGATAIAASLALVLVTRPDPVVQTAPPPAQVDPMVAAMGSEESDARLIATWDPGDQSLVVAAAAGMEPVSGHSHELWVIPADGVPRSIGVMPASARMHLRVPGALSPLLNQDATLAVSVEPSGGSPTGQPTGAVIAAGKLERT